MISLGSVRRLQAFNTQRQRRCERGIDKALRALAPLERELIEIEQQIQRLTELLASNGAEGVRLSQEQLFAHLRHLAVIRRQISHLALNQAQVTTQHTEVAQGIEDLYVQRKVLQVKDLKLSRLEKYALVEQRTHYRRQEENEIEELLVNSR